MGRWGLAVDYGTSYTAAAIARDSSLDLLYFNGVPRIPSVVLRSESGEILVGTTAENETLITPDRVLRAPKRRLGDRIVLVGDAPMSVIDAVAAVLRAVVEEATRQQGGSGPDRVVMTHPARWGSERLNALRAAAESAGLPDPEFLAEPVAAAIHYLATGDDSVPPGKRVAVYDLGGGTFDTAVLERTADEGFEIVAIGGDEYRGGEDFDEILYRHFGSLIADDAPEVWEQLRHSEERPWRKANAEFRRDIRLLKEDLSTTNSRSVYVRYPVDRELRLTRSQLEKLLEPALAETLEELAATIERSGTKTEDLSAVYLVGGSSRIRILPQLVRERFGRADTRDDPKAVVALGAARWVASAPAAEPTEPIDDPTIALSAEPAVDPAAAVIEAPGPPAQVPSASGAKSPIPPIHRGRVPPAWRLGELWRMGRRTPMLLVGAALVAVAVAIGIAAFASGAIGLGGSSPPPEPGAIWAADLDIGDCFNPIGEGSETMDRVTVVECGERHVYEVFHEFEIPSRSSEYPEESAFVTQAGHECGEAAEEYVGEPLENRDLEPYLLYPLEEEWLAGDHTLTCTLHRADGGLLTASQAVGEN